MPHVPEWASPRVQSLGTGHEPAQLLHRDPGSGQGVAPPVLGRGVLAERVHRVTLHVARPHALAACSRALATTKAHPQSHVIAYNSFLKQNDETRIPHDTGARSTKRSLFMCYDSLLSSCDCHRRKEVFYLTMHSTHFIYVYMASDIW